jgi:hypothetical protein
MTNFGMIFGALLSATVAASGQQSRGIRYGPGVCGPLDPVYVKTSTETGGQPFPLSTAELSQSARAMEASLLPQMILWASGERENEYAIPVDSTVTRVMIAGTFDGTGGSLTLSNPDGAMTQQSERVQDTPLNCGRIVTIDAPAAGVWQLRVIPTAHFWLSVHAKSSLSLSGAEFVEQEAGSGRLVRIQGEPIAGMPATLRASVSSGIRNPTFQLVSLEARPLQRVELQSGDRMEFSGTITLPSEPFRVLVSGSDEAGTRIQRIWAGLFHGEVIEIVPPEGATVVAGAQVPVTFKIRNHGAPVRLALVASDHRGKLIAVNPATLDIGASAEETVTIMLAVPADAQPSSEVSIRLTATAETTGALGGFNSAAKTFTVRREQDLDR